VKNLDNDVLANSKITFEALDAKGQRLELPACKLVFLPPGDGQCSIDLPHIPLACTRIRLRVEGYKAIEVDVVEEKELHVGRQVELAKG
jgi:urease beta subunit